MSQKRLLFYHLYQVPTEGEIVLLVDVGVSVVALRETVVSEVLVERHGFRGGMQRMLGECLARSLVRIPGQYIAVPNVTMPTCLGARDVSDRIVDVYGC